ncbi:MAG TPA: ABC transporter ATP-binding protein, partial [Vicinamibacteria bacterium]
PLRVLDGVSLELAPGDALAVMGPSGSGKSTLLHLLGTLDRPTSGRLRLFGQDPTTLDEAEAAAFRNREIGFVFQDHGLLPQLGALENVVLPTLVAAERPGAPERLDRARVLLEAVGLAARSGHRPAQLSGGEKQRVAIARALVMEPRLLLCDEPTGNLDRRAADAVADLLLELQARSRAILVVVTHSAELAARLPRRVHLDAGRLQPA